MACASPVRQAARISPKTLSPQLYQRVVTTARPSAPARLLITLWPERPQEVLGSTAQTRLALCVVAARLSIASTPQLSFSDTRNT
jgi:hypothetical protein